MDISIKSNRYHLLASFFQWKNGKRSLDLGLLKSLAQQSTLEGCRGGKKAGKWAAKWINVGPTQQPWGGHSGWYWWTWMSQSGACPMWSIIIKVILMAEKKYKGSMWNIFQNDYNQTCMQFLKTYSFVLLTGKETPDPQTKPKAKSQIYWEALAPSHLPLLVSHPTKASLTPGHWLLSSYYQVDSLHLKTFLFSAPHGWAGGQRQACHMLLNR